MNTLSILLMLYTYVVVLVTLTTHIHQFIILTPNQDTHIGASISIMNSSNLVSTNTYKNQWEVISPSNEWFMKLHLNSLWGFDKHTNSIINIIIDSPTILGPTTFNNIIIGIKVPQSNKYIALDLNYNGINKIIPTCDVSNEPITSMKTMNTNEIIHKNISQSIMLPLSNGQNIAFPMTITLINYPKKSTDNINGYSYIKYSCNGFNVVQSCGFEPFDTEKGLDIYFALGNAPKETQIILNSFTIQYTCENSTTGSNNNPSDTQSVDEYSNSDSSSSDESNESPTQAAAEPIIETETETMDMWNAYLGVWIVVLTVPLACLSIGILLYCSQYDKGNKKIKTTKEEDESIRHEKQSLMTTDLKTSVSPRISNASITIQSRPEGMNRMETSSDFDD